jgi:hypothetical protein
MSDIPYPTVQGGTPMPGNSTFSAQDEMAQRAANAQLAANAAAAAQPKTAAPAPSSNTAGGQFMDGMKSPIGGAGSGQKLLGSLGSGGSTGAPTDLSAPATDTGDIGGTGGDLGGLF